jgi:hypothetical protein
MANNDACKERALNAAEPDAGCFQNTETGSMSMDVCTKPTSEFEFSDVVRLFSKSEKEVVIINLLLKINVAAFNLFSFFSIRRQHPA